MKRIAWVGLIVALIAGPVAAFGPETSRRPHARPDIVPIATVSTQSSALIRPQTRPAAIRAAIGDVIGRALPQALTSDDLAANTAGVALIPASMGSTKSLRPVVRPRAVVENAFSRRRELNRGKLCGDRDLQGEHVGFVPGKLGGCGIKDAVRLRSVAGITLSQPALIDCTTANALNTWIRKGLKPAVGNRGGGIEQIRVAAHYSCRTRNNQPGARISEHGRGKAIDISAIRFSDGSELTVLKGWGGGKDGRALKKMHSAACGPFGTVLGPESDRFHQDHFHFDTAKHGNGSYCR